MASKDVIDIVFMGKGRSSDPRRPALLFECDQFIIWADALVYDS
jgi:hypothetical protein